MTFYSVKRVVGESYPVLFVCVLIGILAGVTLQNSLDRIEGSLVLVMVPILNGIGGNLGSILGARLASALHMGTVSPELRGKALKENVKVSALTGILIFLFSGAVVFMMAVWRGLSPIDSLKSTAVFIIAAMLLLPVIISSTVLLSLASFKKGLDPDNVVIPIVTSIIDVSAAACLLIISVNIVGM